MYKLSISGFLALGLIACAGSEGSDDCALRDDIECDEGSDDSLASTPASSADPQVLAAQEGANGAAPAAAGGELRTVLGGRRFSFHSSETDSGYSREIVSALVTCKGGAFFLKQDLSMFGSGIPASIRNNWYAGTWTLESNANAAVLRLVFSQTNTSDTDPLRFAVGVQGGQVFVHDGSSLRVSSDRQAASVSDATAECAELEGSAPSPPATPGAAVPSAVEPAPQCTGAPGAVDACDVCLLRSCCAPVQACLPGTPCAHLFECQQLCPALDDACVQSRCAADVVDGVAAASTLTRCISDSCATACQNT